MRTPPSTNRRRSLRRGQSIIEFTFVGIPLMFVLISIFEMSRGMWMYHTLAHATKTAVRYSIVHGQNCVPPSTNTCSRTIGHIALEFKKAAVGIDEATTTMTFYTAASTTTCALNTCLGNPTVWPPAGGNAPGQILTIEAATPFRSAIALFWPGSSPVTIGRVNLPARSSDRVAY